METYYLCRVPAHEIIVVYAERDYKYQRHHEANLRVPNPNYNVELLAKGTKKQMWMYYHLMNDGG